MSEQHPRCECHVCCFSRLNQFDQYAMRELSRKFTPAIESARNVRAEVLEECWQVINALIIPGKLQGNGWDKSAERNGYIMAANQIMALIQTGET